MSYMTPAILLPITDKLTAWYLSQKTAMDAAAVKAQDCEDLIIGTSIVAGIGDYTIETTLMAPFHNLVLGSTSAGIAQALGSNPLASLENSCSAAGLGLSISTILGIETFAENYNITDATKWQCLFAPNFRDLWMVWRSSSTPQAYNYYFEVLQGATYTNGLRKLVVVASTPTQTAGTDIDSTKYAGGYGQIVTTGFAGTSDTVTVTGLWRKTDGTTHSANGTATVTGNNTYVLTPPAANELLITCTGITAGANITGLTCYVEAKRPAGRTNPPT